MANKRCGLFYRTKNLHFQLTGDSGEYYACSYWKPDRYSPKAPEPTETWICPLCGPNCKGGAHRNAMIADGVPSKAPEPTGGDVYKHKKGSYKYGCDCSTCKPIALRIALQNKAPKPTGDDKVTPTVSNVFHWCRFCSKLTAHNANSCLNCGTHDEPKAPTGDDKGTEPKMCDCGHSKDNHFKGAHQCLYTQDIGLYALKGCNCKQFAHPEPQAPDGIEVEMPPMDITASDLNIGNCAADTAMDLAGQKQIHSYIKNAVAEIAAKNEALAKVEHHERTSKWITDSRALKLYKEKAEKVEKERDEWQTQKEYFYTRYCDTIEERDAALEDVKKYQAHHNTYVYGVMAHEEYRKQTEEILGAYRSNAARFEKEMDLLKAELDELRKTHDAALEPWQKRVFELKAELSELRKQGTFDDGVEATTKYFNSIGWDISASEIRCSTGDIRQLKRTPPVSEDNNDR